MRRIIGAALVATGLLASGPAFATNGMRMIGFGPVQGSMGGVGVGATLDGNALATNPAGIADLGSRLDVAIGYFKPSVSHQATGTPTGAPPPNPPSMIASDGRTIDSDRGGSPIPAVAFIQPLNDQLSAGLGLFAVSGMGVDYPTSLYLSPALTSYLNARLTPGIAFKLNDFFSVGVALNVMMAQMEYGVAQNLPAAMGGQAKHGTATSWGYGATLGVKITPIPVLTLGAAYETRSRFQDFTFDVPGGKDKLRLDQPQVATVGAALRPFDGILLAADLEWIDWSSTMGTNLPRYSERQPTTMPFDMGWKDQWVVKLGAQATVTKGLLLRAGYNYGKMPLDASRAFENLVFPAVTEHHFTAGAGYAASEKIGVQLTGMYSPTARISGANAGPPPGGQMISSYSTKMSQLQIDLGATYRF
jgi:long-chain fatty acid transport protein